MTGDIDEAAGGEVTGDEAVGDEVAGDEVSGDEAVGDEVTTTNNSQQRRWRWTLDQRHKSLSSLCLVKQGQVP